MTYVASISSLYIDACITYATLSVCYFALSKNEPFSYRSALWKRILLGIVAGLAVLYLDQSRLILKGNIYHSFAMIPMILVIFFGGGISGVVSYLVKLVFTGGITVDNLFIASIIVPLLLEKVWRKKSHRVFYLTIAAVALYRIVTVAFLVDIKTVWFDVFLYQSFSALCLIICYHALNMKERHIHAYFSMRDQATTDGLTHINNRASVDDKLMLHHTQRKSCGLLILDLDNFKQVNDVHGHLGGDALLVGVGRILQDSVRNGDFVGRYGGEEFIVLTESHDPEAIAQVAERIRSNVAAKAFDITEGETVHITLSIGVSLYLPGMVVDKAIEMADEALYQAKRQGKNQVVFSRLMQFAPLA
jgi:diguanylate cyclase